MEAKETIIRPVTLWQLPDIKELWAYRELLYFFSWRDLKVRYKQTLIGVAWAILQPLITMVVFSVFFGQLAKMPSEGIPYPLFVYCGLVFWNLFITSVGDISNCLINNQSIVTKVYFPRLLLPFSYILTNFVDFAISGVILFVLMIFFGFVPTLNSLLIMPLLILITFLSSVGLGLILASINVKYRDVRYVLPFFLQILLFITPVIYAASLLGDYTVLFGLNPMAGVISTARAVFFGLAPISWLSLGFSTLVSLLFLVVGILVFRRAEMTFADTV